MGRLLTKVLRGVHAPITQTVKITQERGNGLIYTNLTNGTVHTENVYGEQESDHKPTKALTEVEELKDTIDPEENSPKALKEMIQKDQEAGSPVPPAPVEMTPDQEYAMKMWPKVLSQEMTKVALAKACNTSTRSLDRWAKRFNFPQQ